MLFLIFGLSALALIIMMFGLLHPGHVEPEIVEAEIVEGPLTKGKCPCETCETDGDVFETGSFLDRDHYHNMDGQTDPEFVNWTHCLSITHCPSICDCYLDGKCTAELLPEPLDYQGKHRA